MNISFTNRTTTSVEVEPGSFYEDVDGRIYCAVYEDHYIYVYESYSGEWSYIKTQALNEGETIDALSSFGRVLIGDEFIQSTKGRFEAHLAKVFVNMTNFKKPVRP
jgi:hypothetical protein